MGWKREGGGTLGDTLVRVLLIEDNPGDARLIQEMLAEAIHPHFSVSHEKELAPALKRMADETFDAIVSDLSLPDAQELEAVTQLQQHAGRVPFVMLTGLDSHDLALQAVRQGAQDYLVKGQFDGNLLVRAVRYAMERKQIEEALTQARNGLEQRVEERTAQLESVNDALVSEIAERMRIEQALRDLNENLEQRVLERTAELTEMNIQLTREIGERKRTESELLRRNRELLSLQTAITATAASLDLQFVLDTVTWEMANLLEVDGCTIFAWDREDDRLSRVAQYPLPNQEQEEEQATIDDLADYQSRRRLLTEKSVQQMTASQDNKDPAEWGRMQRAGVKSLLMIPMVFQDRVIGMFEMRSCQVERLFTEYEISLAHLLANQAASAIENAKLYERAQTEIARRREAEERIRDSLREKEVLLQEIHHRVKNNLQVVSSLLYLQSESVTDPKLLSVLQDSQNRVRSMALVHERLYRSEDIARIDFQQYIHDLAAHLLTTYSVDAHGVRVVVDADDVILDVNTAMPCGLIINELISNSLKHAFTNSSQPEVGRGGARQAVAKSPDSTMDDRQDEICIELREEQEGRLMLLVGDNGVGLPESVDFRNSPSLGLLLVNSLVRQLRGTIELDRQRGTQFKIAFNVP